MGPLAEPSLGVSSGDRSAWAGLKGSQGACGDTGRGGHTHPLTTQGPSFLWQSCPEKPGAQEHW